MTSSYPTLLPNASYSYIRSLVAIPDSYADPAPTSNFDTNTVPNPFFVYIRKFIFLVIGVIITSSRDVLLTLVGFIESIKATDDCSTYLLSRVRIYYPHCRKS
jgi:hypothetical protein